MKLTKEMMRLYAVTDRSWLRGQTLFEQVEQALIGGATLLQLREKELDEETFLREAIELAKLCHRYGVPTMWRLPAAAARTAFTLVKAIWRRLLCAVSSVLT